jgi:hypothetical protein
MILGTPFYMVKDGYLLHKMRYDIKSLVAIGQIDFSLDYADDSIKNFKLIADRNALNMQITSNTIIYNNENDLITKFENIINENYHK